MCYYKMTDGNGDEEQLVEDQLRTYGLIKFPESFMNIGEQTFAWVYQNRPEWVKFSEKWETATGLFQFWYLYVKLRGSLLKNTHDDDKHTNGNTDSNESPIYTVPLDE